MKDNTNMCDLFKGELPSCAPLAMAYVPMQQSASPMYESGEALCRGTLFPALDLPFMNIVNCEDAEKTPLVELMALDFVCNELLLYLDTHKDDTEAFEAYKGFLKLSFEARQKYCETYGPLGHIDMMEMGTFTWLNNPWPWEYIENEFPTPEL